MVGMLSIQQLLTTPIYLAAFVSRNNKRTNFNRTFKSMLNHLVIIGEQRLGYKVVHADGLSFGKTEAMQHPVIPTRIYIGLINRLGDLLDQAYPGVDRFESFIASFEDFFFGRPEHNQKSLGVGGKEFWRPTFEQALSDHGLSEVMAGEFACSDRRNLSKALLSLQCVVKTIIHLYTGMRDQEVLRLCYDCLSEEIVAPEIVDDLGVVRDRAKMVSIISTTTKFVGYRKQESWLATGEVIKAVKVAQAICGGLAALYGLASTQDLPLFLNPAILLRKNTEVGVGRMDKSVREMNWAASILIHPDDLRELSISDFGRDFYREKKFSLGQPWPLSSHQFRRSLAFYASSSGFVSLPSLKSQYKHMTLQMTRYYANGFENLKTIFGYYNSDKNEFVLPASHIALEFQMGMPMSVATQLLADVVGKAEPLFGGTGSYMEKQKARVEKGEVCVEEVRAETLIRVKSGELSYRPTLLGGCTKVGRCDSFLLGDFTECLSCEGAIIKPFKLNAAIEDATNELSQYAEGSGEYQIVKGDVERLVAFKTRLIDTVGL
ncbi:TPA: integrase [Pseudomonas aeruginosa]|nr:integrase [Pseudomonas aeruginosa]HCA5868836.1 integrase [Pseudomonas aeruginosa]HCA7379613.1 integrase [Pseudomonas aeruginosa]HCA7777474.1 integrase [Pseudomonas aeruginosa]